MNFLSRLFNNKKIDCPRCLGKGNVDLEDIKRLRKELYWAPGKCAYCEGTGKVPPNRVSMVSVDTEYLTTDLPKEEKKRLFNGDSGALKRAKEFEKEINEFIKQIEHLYYIENQEADQIADYFLRKHERSGNSSSERQEVIEYIEKVIKSKQVKK
ncbi:MAG: hypothetical protein SFU87_21210 [Chitinophagaceae bacterium]|nr:hypothetical protein [Chitinophagaceae bacterium]